MLALAVRAPLRLRALLAVPAAIAALLGAALLVDAGGEAPGSRASFRLREIAEGVTATEAAGRAVLLSRTGDEVVAFLPGVPDAAMGRDVAIPCPGGRYWTEIRASIFAADGTKVGGPAPRGLDRYATTVRFDEVVVDTSKVIRGEGLQGPAPVLLAAGPEWERSVEQATIDGFCAADISATSSPGPGPRRTAPGWRRTAGR